MAAVYQSIGTDDYITSGTSLSPGAPSGVASGDILLLFLNVELGGAPTTPVGWTLINSQVYWFSTGAIYAYWREADGTSSDTPTVSLASAPTSARAVIVRTDGVDTASPIDASSFLDTNSSSEPMTHPSVTVTSADSLAVIMGGSYLNETGTYTFGNGFTERLGTTSNEAMWVGTKAVGSGATGTTDVTNSTTLIRSGVCTIALAPSAGGGAYTLSADAGSYALTGTAATLKADRSLSASAGSYSVTGVSADLLKGFTLTAGSGSYALSGTVAALRATRALSAGAGSYSISGATSGLKVGRMLSADAGGYTVTGTAANLIYGSPGAYTLVADPGSYSATGQTASLSAGRKMAASSSSYSVTGQALSFYRGFTLSAVAGSYSVTGQSADLLRTYTMAAESGSYELTGVAAALTYSGASVWTQQPDATTTWTLQTDSSDTWTIQ